MRGMKLKFFVQIRRPVVDGARTKPYGETEVGLQESPGRQSPDGAVRP